MFRIFFLAVLCLTAKFFSVHAQNADSLKRDTVHNFIILDSRFQNQFSFLGRNYGFEFPFLTASVSYYLHSNLWIGVTGFFFFDESVPKQTGLTVGYLKEVSDKSDWQISYTQFYIPDSSVPQALRTQGYAQTSIGLDWKILYSILQVHALLNNHSDVFITMHHSRYFQFTQLLWKKIKVSFEPTASCTGGTHRFDYADIVVAGPGGGVFVPPTTGDESGGKKLDLLNWDFLFPLKFEIGNFSLETSWRYTAPLNTVPEDPSEPLHQFAVNLNYSIPIRRIKG